MKLFDLSGLPDGINDVQRASSSTSATIQPTEVPTHKDVDDKITAAQKEWLASAIQIIAIFSAVLAFILVNVSIFKDNILPISLVAALIFLQTLGIMLITSFIMYLLNIKEFDSKILFFLISIFLVFSVALFFLDKSFGYYKKADFFNASEFINKKIETEYPLYNELSSKIEEQRKENEDLKKRIEFLEQK